MLTFIHAADLHLDSPLIGLPRYDGAPVEQMRGSTRRALENLVDLAFTEQVAFVLIAGDLYDGDWRDYNTGLFFAAQMTRLREAGTPVFIVSGNHDAASQITRSLRMPDNVTVLPANSPDTVRLDDIGIAVHGQSFRTRAVADDLSAAYPDPVCGMFNIGLLHTSADGRPGHDPYAPCSLDKLRAKGYDYWALGHVHAREVLCADPWVVFSGNTQGRHIRELGEKGCTLVTLEDGAVLSVEPKELDVARWAVCEVGVPDANGEEDVASCAAAAVERELVKHDGRPLAVRFRLSSTPATRGEVLADEERWINEVRAAVTDISGGLAWVEKVVVQTTPSSISPMDEGAAGELLAAIYESDPSEEDLQQLVREVRDFVAKLPPELRTSEDGQELVTETAVREMLGEAKALLGSRLFRQDGEQ
jgi:DNA repair exonuclease SbcCD nuclease subunit